MHKLLQHTLDSTVTSSTEQTPSPLRSPRTIILTHPHKENTENTELEPIQALFRVDLESRGSTLERQSMPIISARDTSCLR